MRFRPRYSLLTLLVLMALIAGGAMYFRIPHRAIVSNPRTDEEQQYLTTNSDIREFVDFCGPTQLEYEYLKTWNGNRWLTVVGRPMKNLLLMVEHDRRPSSWRVYDQERSAELLTDAREPQETIVAWVMACTNSPYEKQRRFRTRDPVAYLLTNSGRVFRAIDVDTIVTAWPEDADEIADPDVRSRVIVELSKRIEHR